MRHLKYVPRFAFISRLWCGGVNTLESWDDQDKDTGTHIQQGIHKVKRWSMSTQMIRIPPLTRSFCKLPHQPPTIYLRVYLTLTRTGMLP